MSSASSGYGTGGSGSGSSSGGGGNSSNGTVRNYSNSGSGISDSSGGAVSGGGGGGSGITGLDGTAGQGGLSATGIRMPRRRSSGGDRVAAGVAVNATAGTAVGGAGGASSVPSSVVPFAGSAGTSIGGLQHQQGAGTMYHQPPAHQAAQSQYYFLPERASSSSSYSAVAAAGGVSSSNARDRQSLSWTRVVPAPGSTNPPPRSGAASVVVRGRLYMFGGYGGGTGRLDDFYSFSFDTQTWEEVRVASGAKPGCRENNGVVIGDSSRVYLFGGYNGTSWLNDLWSFDIDTARWECIQESSDPQATVTATAVVGGGAAAAGAATDLQAGAAGGGDGSTRAAGSGAGFSSIATPSVAPSRRFGYVSVVHKGKFVLFGGFDGSRWLNDMHEFDFKTKTWREIHARGTLPSVRSCPAWAKDDKNVYIQGGYDGVERKADFFACDLSTYTWTEMPCRGTPPSPRYFHSCCLYGNKMYAYGGYSGSERLADMYAYDFDTHHWSEVEYGNTNRDECPSGRSSLVAQVYENSLYIFGGYNGVTVLNDFYKFRLKPVSVPPPVLVNDLFSLINKEEYSDVTFLVEGKEVHANRAILAVRSEYFRAMLYSVGMRESIQVAGVSCQNDDDFHRRPIEVLDVSYDVFLRVMEYLYTDSVRDITFEVGVPLLIMSERFMLDRLKGLCEDSLRQDIGVENVISLYIASHRHNASGLKDIALEYILKHIKDPVIMNGLADLKLEPDLLVEIIKRSSAGMGGEGFGGGPIGVGGLVGAGGGNRPSGPFGSSSEWSGTRR